MTNKLPAELKKHFPSFRKLTDKHQLELLIAFHAGIEVGIVEMNDEAQRLIAAGSELCAERIAGQAPASEPVNVEQEGRYEKGIF